MSVPKRQPNYKRGRGLERHFITMYFRSISPSAWKAVVTELWKRGASRPVRRPQRGSLLAKRLHFPTAGAFVVSPGVAAVCKLAVVEPRKKAQADVYRSYGSIRDFEEMRKAGIS